MTRSQVYLDLQIADILEKSLSKHNADIPKKETIEKWLVSSLEQHILSPLDTGSRQNPNSTTKTALQEYEISIRIVDEEESAALNQQYRQKNMATNVLSFPADLPDYIESPLLGDLLICAPIIKQEAKQQGKDIEQHWAHIIIHGTLHLLGYDHIQEKDAALMESLEVDILNQFNIPNPY